MLPNITEVVLIALIVMIVFGVGKLPRVAHALGRARSEFKKGLRDEKPIDITPRVDGSRTPSGRKPGKFDLPIEDATVEESTLE